MNTLFVMFVALQLVGAKLSIDKHNRLGNLDKDIKTGVRYCQRPTPCQWKVYNVIDGTEIVLVNNYCVCRPGSRCEYHVDRFEWGYIEYRCKPNKK